MARFDAKLWYWHAVFGHASLPPSSDSRPALCVRALLHRNRTSRLHTAEPAVLRDTDGCSYIKEDAGKWLVGAFQPDGKPLEISEIPADTPFIELPENWDEFELPFSKATEILPALHNAGIAKFLKRT